MSTPIIEVKEEDDSKSHKKQKLDIPGFISTKECADIIVPNTLEFFFKNTDPNISALFATFFNVDFVTNKLDSILDQIEEYCHQYLSSAAVPFRITGQHIRLMFARYFVAGNNVEQIKKLIENGLDLNQTISDIVPSGIEKDPIYPSVSIRALFVYDVSSIEMAKLLFIPQQELAIYNHILFMIPICQRTQDRNNALAWIIENKCIRINAPIFPTLGIANDAKIQEACKHVQNEYFQKGFQQSTEFASTVPEALYLIVTEYLMGSWLKPNDYEEKTTTSVTQYVCQFPIISSGPFYDIYKSVFIQSDQKDNKQDVREQIAELLVPYFHFVGVFCGDIRFLAKLCDMMATNIDAFIPIVTPIVAQGLDGDNPVAVETINPLVTQLASVLPMVSKAINK